jgi:curli biogenesis system outer membrane secretion channel CsgG
MGATTHGAMMQERKEAMISNDTFRILSRICALVVLFWGTQSFAAKKAAVTKAGGGLRYTVIVDNFENKSEGNRMKGEWATMLTSALQENGHFIVVAQTEAQLNVLNQQIRALSGATKQNKKVAVRGLVAPAQILIRGVITHIKEGAADQGGGWRVGKLQLKAARKKTEIHATLQMIDTTTGALLAAKNFIGASIERDASVKERDENKDKDDENNIKLAQADNVHTAFEKAIVDVIPWLASKLPTVPWRGSVVKVIDKRIIINRGSREGVSSGDEFIAGESEILRDPGTGEILEEVVHERVRIRVDDVSERTSTCSIVSGDASQLVEGMGVRYSREKD